MKFSLIGVGGATPYFRHGDIIYRRVMESLGADVRIKDDSKTDRFTPDTSVQPIAEADLSQAIADLQVELQQRREHIARQSGEAEAAKVPATPEVRTAAAASDKDAKHGAPVKRGRGRPRKHTQPEQEPAASDPPAESPASTASPDEEDDVEEPTDISSPGTVTDIVDELAS